MFAFYHPWLPHFSYGPFLIRSWLIKMCSVHHVLLHSLCPFLGPYMVHFRFSLPGVSSWNTIQHIFLQTRTNISTYLNTYIVLQHVSTFHTVYQYIITQHVCIFHSSNSYLQAYMDMGLSNLTQASIHWLYTVSPNFLSSLLYLNNLITMHFKNLSFMTLLLNVKYILLSLMTLLQVSKYILPICRYSRMCE